MYRLDLNNRLEGFILLVNPFCHVFPSKVVRELSSFIQTPHSVSPPFLILITGCKSLQKELALSSDLFSCPKVLLRAHVVPQTASSWILTGKGDKGTLLTAPERSRPALILLPRMCRVLLLPRKKPCGQRCLGPLLEGEGEGWKQSVTGVVTHVQPEKFDSSFNFWLKRHSLCYWDTAS